MPEPPFYPGQSAVQRSRNANRLAERVETNEGRLDQLDERVEGIEEALEIAPSSSGAPPDPTDPGDLIVYFENGLA